MEIAILGRKAQAAYDAMEALPEHQV